MTRTAKQQWGRTAVMGALAASFAVAGCGRGLFGISSSTKPDQDTGVTLSSCFPDHPASCDGTCRQATEILSNKCSFCHEQASYGNFTGLFDANQLTMLSRSGRFPGERYVVPGDPDHSLLYKRTAVTRDMPPPGTLDSPEPTVSPAEIQVLHDWIAGCMGTDHFDGSVGPIDAGPGDAIIIIIENDAAVPPTVPGNVATCPMAAPSGACAVEQQTCAYPDQDCFCDQGTWNCAACPSQQPSIGAVCPNGPDPTYFRPPSSCVYGALTCSCDPRDQSQSDWRCGVCPATEPATGSACGNTMFACSYGNDFCQCLGGTWNCHKPSCPTLGVRGAAQCNSRFSCEYPGLGVACSCRFDNNWSCTCPASLPVDGQACAGLVGVSPCTYGEQACSCAYSDTGLSAWRCVAACPASAPSPGSACHSSLNCSYGSSLCYCDGTGWHC